MRTQSIIFDSFVRLVGETRKKENIITKIREFANLMAHKSVSALKVNVEQDIIGSALFRRENSNLHSDYGIDFFGYSLCE